MSKTRTFVLAAILAGAATLSVHGPAAAQSACNGTVQYHGRIGTQCYYLPTVSNGRVTGLEKHTNFFRNPRWGVGGAAIGQSQASMPCRYLPTVVGGRVIGSHQVCG